MDFEEWYREAKKTNDCGFTAKDFFEAGQQSKQAEIDELIDTIKTSAESEIYLFDELQKVKGERDDLQKRIDDAIYDLQHIESAMWEEQVEHVLMILKGDQS